LAIVLDGAGAGEQETIAGRIGFIERHSSQIVEPVKYLAADSLVIRIIPRIVEKLQHEDDLPVA